VSVVDNPNCAGTELRWGVNEVYGGEAPFEFIWSGPGLLQELDSSNGAALFTRPENEEYALRLIDRCNFYPNVFNYEPDIVFLDKMPNVLTPNGDGRNDFLAILGIDRFPGSTLEVWDRWGKSVFQSNNYRAGNPVVPTAEAFTGEDLNDGAYFYILSIEGGACTKSGYIQLLGSND
jgi:gliding motility-associated-like protein